MGLVLFLTLPGLVILLIVFATVDQLGTWTHRYLRLPWRTGSDGRRLPAPGLEELDAFFVATKRHELSQRQSSLMLRDEVGDGAPPGTTVDLDANRAVVHLKPTPPR